MTAHAPAALAADLEGALRRLKLAAMRTIAPQLLITAKTQRWTPEDLLRALVETEIAARDRDRLAAWRRTPTLAWAPGGERLADVQARVMPGLGGLLTELAAAGSPGSIDAPQVGGYRDAPPVHPWTILVGHDGVFKVLLLTLFDLPLERFWMWSSDLCGITVIEVRAGRPTVRAMNLTEHLANLLDDEAQAATEERARSGAL